MVYWHSECNPVHNISVHILEFNAAIEQNEDNAIAVDAIQIFFDKMY